jgi:hypothetical protein
MDFVVEGLVEGQEAMAIVKINNNNKKTYWFSLVEICDQDWEEGEEMW